MKIHIVDPKLFHVAGHHMEWDLRLAEELTAAGHDVTLFSHKEITEKAHALVSARTRLVPLFRVIPYINPENVDPVAGDVLLFIDGAALIAEDLVRLPPADLWLWPTFFSLHLYACALAKVRTPIAGCFQMEPTYLSPHGRAWTRFAFLKAKEAGLRLHVGVTGPLLQREYAPLTADDGMNLFPVLDDGAPTGIRKERVQTIGFFGMQRVEKGAEIFPELIARLLRDGYHVVLQDSGNLVRAREAPGLTVLGYVSSLAEQMARCDLVVIPNYPPAYRVRWSGVAMEALASGVPVVVPAGTASAFLVQETGAGTTFMNVTVNEVYQAIAEAKQAFPQIARAAFEVSRTWRETHGVKRFVAAMLAGLPSGERTG